MENIIDIAGWMIYIDRLGVINSLEELKEKHDFFTNIPDKDKAFEYLWQIIKPKDEPKEQEPIAD